MWNIIRNADRGEEEQELTLSVSGEQGVGRRGSLCSELPRRGGLEVGRRSLGAEATALPTFWL